MSMDENIINYIESSVQYLSASTNAESFEFDKRKNIHFSIIRYKTHCIEFMYSMKNSRDVPKSLFIMRVAKTDTDLFFELGQFITYMGEPELRCTWYPYISNLNMIRIAFSSLTHIFNEYSERIVSTLNDFAAYNQIIDTYYNEIVHVLKLKESILQKYEKPYDLCMNLNISYEMNVYAPFLANNDIYY